MGKKKWQEDADGFHRRIVDLLRIHERSSFSQKHVKGDFFRVFHEAYKSGYCRPLRYRFYLEADRDEWIWPEGKPMICADSIWSFACEQGWVDCETSGDADRYKRVRRLMTWWEAWTFAFEQLGLYIRRYETVE